MMIHRRSPESKKRAARRAARLKRWKKEERAEAASIRKAFAAVSRALARLPVEHRVRVLRATAALHGLPLEVHR